MPPVMPPVKAPSPRDKLTRLSMTLAVLGAFSTLSFPIVLPFVLGSVALVLAELSRDNAGALLPKGRRASRVAAVVIIVNMFLLVSSAYYFYRVLHEPALQAQFGELLYRTYGITFEEFMEQFRVFYPAAP